MKLERTLSTFTILSLVAVALLVVVIVLVLPFSLLLALTLALVVGVMTYLNYPMLLALKKPALTRGQPSKFFMTAWLFLFKVLKLPQTALVQINNRITGKVSVLPADAHVLVSRCLQSSQCSYNVCGNISNCRECGRCKIGMIKKICQQHELAVTVESGGTVARQRLKDAQPKLVVALACERELLAGIIDVNLPVVGVVIETGAQPCTDSNVALTQMKKTLNKNIREV